MTPLHHPLPPPPPSPPRPVASNGGVPLNPKADLPLHLQLDHIRRMVCTFLGFFFFFSLGSCGLLLLDLLVLTLDLFVWSRFQVLYFALKALRESGHAAVYDAVERPLQLAQTAAIMEVTRSQSRPLFFRFFKFAFSDLFDLYFWFFFGAQILHGLVGEKYVLLPCYYSNSLWSVVIVVTGFLWGKNKRIGEISGIGDFAANWVEAVCYLGHLVEFPWGITKMNLVFFSVENSRILC